MRHLAMAIAAVILVGCQTNGEGPIALTTTVANGYDEYLNLVEDRKVFAVSQDGRTYGYGYCSFAACSDNTGAVAINSCQRGTDRPCRIFANGETIVWDGEVTFPGVQ